MDSKNVIIWPVIISIVGHVALFSASSMIDWRDNVQTAEIFTVDIRDQVPDQTPKKEGKTEKKESKKARAISGDGWREDTVNLGSSDVKYAAYLVTIKKRILQIWEYPKKAYEKNDEGVVVVKMSIDASGSLAETNLMSSSGSTLLDDGALSIVKRAAPFEPLPDSYNLSRLHIVASFRYKLVE
jgi:periplasmic protein TonB